MWSAETVLVCALTLLHRSADSFPPIEFVDARPAYVSANTEGFVMPGEHRIYLVTSSPQFRRARRAMYRCGEFDALRKIASVLIHEEWHLRNGPDEKGAYVAQLALLAYLDAGPGTALFNEVRRSMEAATRKGRGKDAVDED